MFLALYSNLLCDGVGTDAHCEGYGGVCRE